MQELCSHALDTDPEECCGLITGDAAECFRHVWRVSNVMNTMHASDPAIFPRGARHAYYMSETEYLHAISEAEFRGEQVKAVYHSHVEAPAYLSAEDIAYAVNPLFPFPEALQIVLGVARGRIEEAAIFEREGALGEFSPEGGRLLKVVTA